MDWKKIKAEYIAGGTSYRKLADKYGVPRTTLERTAKTEKWTELRRRANGKAEAKLVENVSVKNAKIDDKYYKLVDMVLDKTEMVIEKMPAWTVVTVKEMAMALKYLKECKGVKSEIDLREQEARIANLQKQAEADDDSDAVVKITIEGGDADWQS